ncbi:hypothetical protein bpr_I2349 [Butyrivibrio proteoclasticus B316]|uniref:Uncharacterized protein n=1 Tax=Butyrivibrio proteoclasticus (strain ATCC 51982 / DSM 14932 / B316) TaxID=515622 RepID=E0RZ10_BUTPB|nr:hypothetical protein [Butyrivibrio proteoclasticus]ADL35082.1 hypothetical protein bpr_I2349 [Butyrivibrio proteoclasticus B316]
MKTNKKICIILSVLLAILSFVTIVFIRLKLGETHLRKLYEGYNSMGLYLIVIWQIVIVAGCALFWIRGSKHIEGPLQYIGRGVSLVLSFVLIIFLAGRWLHLIFDYNYGHVALEKDNLMLIRQTSKLEDDSYSIWSRDGLFYRRLERIIGSSADSVAEGIFYAYVSGFEDNLGATPSDSAEDMTDEKSEQKSREYELLNKYIEITENTFPEKFQRGLYWEEKECSENAIGTVQVAILEEGGMQDMTWFCENFCDWLEECLQEVPYDEAPWIYKAVGVIMPSVTGEFDPSPYIEGNYNRDALYEGIYDFIDTMLTSEDYPEQNINYGMLEFVDNGSDDYLKDIEPDCTYTTNDGITYGMYPVDRAAGSSYYILAAYKKAGDTPEVINEYPFGGSGGQATWITFIDDTNLGFACLTYNGGDNAYLYRTEDGGRSFTQINYPSAKVKLADGTIYNPFLIPEKVWADNGDIYLLAGQSQWSGDYYSEKLGKHPSGLYVSHNKGLSFEYVGEK